MVVTVRLHATLRRPIPGDGYQSRLTVEMPGAATVASLLERLELNVAPQPLMIVINHRRVEPDHVLQPGDEVHLFPPISGGAGHHASI